MTHSKNQTVKVITAKPYHPPQNASWKIKALDCLIFRSECATTIDILTCVIGEDVFNKLSDKEREKQIGTLSVTLNNLVKEDYVKKVKIKGLKGNYYGLSKWFDDNGNLKEEYANGTLNYLLETRKEIMSRLQIEKPLEVPTPPELLES